MTTPRRADLSDEDVRAGVVCAARDRGRQTVAETDLTDLSVSTDREGQHWSLRWILTHLLEETARHNGHADLLREAIDGSIGSPRSASPWPGGRSPTTSTGVSSAWAGWETSTVAVLASLPFTAARPRRWTPSLPTG